MSRPNLLIIPILSLFLVVPGSGAWEDNSAKWWLTYGGVLNKCLKLEGYSEPSAHGYCQCMSRCFAHLMDESTKKDNGEVARLVNVCGTTKCKVSLLKHIEAKQAPQMK